MNKRDKWKRGQKIRRALRAGQPIKVKCGLLEVLRNYESPILDAPDDGNEWLNFVLKAISKYDPENSPKPIFLTKDGKPPKALIELGRKLTTGDRVA